MFQVNTTTKKFVESASLDLGLLPAEGKIDMQLTDGTDPVIAEGKTFAMTIGTIEPTLYKTDDDTVSFRYIQFDETNVATTLAVTLTMDGVEVLDDTIALTYTEAGGGDPFPQGGYAGDFLQKTATGQTWAEVPSQQQADWNQSSSSAPDFIKNKPTIPTVNDATVTINQGGVQKGTFTLNQSGNATIDLNDGAQADWNQTSSSAPDYIKNKPVLPDFVAIEKKLDDYETMLNKHILTHTPLCIEAVGGQMGFVLISRNNTAYAFDLEYSWDNETWAPLEWDGNSAKYRDANNNLQYIDLYYNIPSYPHNRVYLRGNNPALRLPAYSNCQISIGANNNNNISFKVSGNAMSLLYKSGYAGAKMAPAQCFSGLFASNQKLVDAGDLILPATTLGAAAYNSMFYNCQNLVTAPELPATTLADNCYGAMFNTCVNLTSIRVAFTSWGSNNNQYTNYWMENAGGYVDNPVFYCPSALDATNIGNNGIPTGWTVERI